MIVCSCNVLSDHDVRTACSGAQAPRTPGQVYGCLGCSPQCGRCARTIKAIMDEALGACGKACCPGCPHTAGHSESQVLLLDSVELHVEVHGHSHVGQPDQSAAA
jgi:bacterioferritin-associated ferredoxin